MEIGGKQGSRLTGRMFSKMMDLISEELSETNMGFKIDIDFIVDVADDTLLNLKATEEKVKLMFADTFDFIQTSSIFSLMFSIILGFCSLF